MIVRIQGEGQYELDDDAVHRLHEMDSELFAAIEGEDEQAFHQALGHAIDFVETNGTCVADERIVPSDIILPPSDISLDEARRLFTDEGLMKPVEA